ncbi:MAG TPA: DUF742 domain-containing protein [Trebonia sp.]
MTEAGAGACLALLASPRAMSGAASSGDEDPGPLVRPFAVTRGRAGQNLHGLDILTLVTAARSEADHSGLDREYREILRLCQHRTLSIAEIAAHVDLLLAAVKVLVGDLIGTGCLRHRPPSAVTARADINLLQVVLEGVRKL